MHLTILDKVIICSFFGYMSVHLFSKGLQEFIDGKMEFKGKVFCREKDPGGFWFEVVRCFASVCVSTGFTIYIATRP